MLVPLVCRQGFRLLALLGALVALIETLRADPASSVLTGTNFLRHYAETRGFMLGRPVNATPTPDGTAVLFLRAKSAREPSQGLFEFDVATRQTRQLLAPEDALKGTAESLSPEEKARRERQRISVGGFTAFSISKDSALVLLSLSGKLYVLRRADGSVRELATGPGTIVDPKFSPDDRSVAYVRNQDVCVFDLASGRERAVTVGGTEEKSHGLAEFVAQEEMDRDSGYWWSPDSRRIVYQESDASEVESWYAADPAQPGNPPSRTFYPRPGKPNVKVGLRIVDVDAPEKSVLVEWDHAKYEYLGKVTWGEHGPLTLTVLSRDQTDLALLSVDPETGKTAALLTEHDDAWVNLPQDVPVWLSEEDRGGFLWASERRGKHQLERHSNDGALEKVVVPPAFGFRHLVGVAAGQVYFLGDAKEPAALEILRMPLNGDQGIGWPLVGHWHGAILLDEHAKIMVDQSDDLAAMPRVLVRRLPEGEVIGELPSIALEPTIDTVVRIGRYAEREFSGVLLCPANVDPGNGSQKLPVLVDVYGGPGHQQVIGAQRTYLLDQWLANQGFIVVRMDGRGTPGRDRDWERAIAGHFGSVPLDDQIAALRALGERFAAMDLDRVGITGWSFGGYMSALAVLRRPDVFKAAVAGAPVTDWLDYDTCYTERYLGVPGAGRWPDAYKEGSLLTYAGDLSRPLLLIHGTADDNVYFRHSLKLEEALFRAGKQAEFLPLNSFTHMVPDPVVRTRLEERIVGFFKEHLATP